MIKVFILITLLFFSFFLYKKLNQFDKQKNKKPKDKIIFLIFATFLIFIFLYIFTIEENTNKTYYPPKFDGENLKPGFFSETE